MRHLESQRSLLALGKDSPGLSALAKKMRLAPDHHVAVVNAPPGCMDQLAPAPADLYTALKDQTQFDVVQLFVNSIDELRTLAPSAIKAVTKRDVLGELTGVTGYKPVAFVKIDDNWTALRFKKT